jgi:hypothetical protein
MELRNKSLSSLLIFSKKVIYFCVYFKLIISIIKQYKYSLKYDQCIEYTNNIMEMQMGLLNTVQWIWRSEDDRLHLVPFFLDFKAFTIS